MKGKQPLLWKRKENTEAKQSEKKNLKAKNAVKGKIQS
jgi:hypothetical protein